MGVLGWVGAPREVGGPWGELGNPSGATGRRIAMLGADGCPQ